MKTKLYILLFAVLSFASCRQAEKADDTQLRTGDLIFVGIPYDYELTDTSGMDAAIVDATGDSLGVNYIHVAIVEVDGDSVWIIDATAKRGVDRYPIDTFCCDFRLKDGSYPQFDVMRLKESPDCADFIENAKGYIGRKYDLAFSPDNEEQYCSELVRNAFRNADGSYIFGEAPMNFKGPDGEFPPYWVQLFEWLGSPIPQDVMGTNPNDMSKDTNLVYIMSLNCKTMK